jgi:hypothetical protein
MMLDSRGARRGLMSERAEWRYCLEKEVPAMSFLSVGCYLPQSGVGS